MQKEWANNYFSSLLASFEFLTLRTLRGVFQEFLLKKELQGFRKASNEKIITRL